MRFTTLFLVLLLAACDDRGDPGIGAETAGEAAPAGFEADDAALARAVASVLERSTTLADSVEDLLRPVPLMRPGDEASLRRYSNAANLERARRFGSRVGDRARLEALIAEERLVQLEDSADHWVLRELGASHPYVTPATRALLDDLGAEFQRRLEAMGLPPYRMEISSVLRTTADQARLRGRNVNAAAGASAHEYGTTVDIAYSGYAAPAELPEPLTEAVDAAPADARPALEAIARITLERMAARKSRELQAILGEVLRDAQSRGEVLVTLERLQPVYHITLGEAR